MPVPVQACASNTDEVEQRIGHIRRIDHEGVLWVYRRSLLLVLKMSRSTLSNVDLTLCVYYTSPKSITLRLMPEDGREPR